MTLLRYSDKFYEIKIYINYIMEILNYKKTFSVYSIKCNVTNKIYIGSTSNLTSRICNHLSTYKKGNSKCYSRFVLENNDYTISVLKNNLENKEQAFECEYNFIKAYGDETINKNKPMLIDAKEYQRNYQAEYRKNKKLQNK